MAAIQEHVDNAVSKTINLPTSASIQQVADIYQQAWEMGLKGVTVYRYGSKSQEILQLGLAERSQDSRHSPDGPPDPCCQ